MFGIVEDPRAFEEGRVAWEMCWGNPVLAHNPYPPRTDSWMSWNLGWNARMRESA